MDIGVRIKKIVGEQLGIALADIRNDHNFVNDLGADSLDIIEIVMAVEDTFGMEITDEEAGKLTTVQEVIDCVRRPVTPQPAECNLDPYFIAAMYAWLQG